jgi:hypothetical protein
MAVAVSLRCKCTGPTVKADPFAVAVFTPRGEAQGLGRMVFVVVLESVAVLPTGTEDVKGKAEFSVVIVDGDGAVGFAGLVPDDGEREAKLPEQSEGCLEVVVGNAVALPDDRSNLWWLGRCGSASWSRSASRRCGASGWRREVNVSGSWFPRAWGLRERTRRAVLSGKRRLPGLLVELGENLGDKADPALQSEPALGAGP